MSGIVQQLWRMSGGVHPEFHKAISTHSPIETSAIPNELIVPLQQHVGHLPDLQVSVGDTVYKGQVLATSSHAGVSAAVHAPSSGTVSKIDNHALPHPSALPGLCVTIKTDGKDDWGSERMAPLANYTEQSPEELLARIDAAGVVGLGGAVFPSEVKLASAGQSRVDTLIINGAECEPYISCDDMLMRERAAEVLQGIDIVMYLLKAKRCLIGIEDNKPEAVAALKAALEQNTQLANAANIEVIAVPTMYPSGDARQLTKILTGLEIPRNVRSPTLGSLCHNVGTVYSIYCAVVRGEPLLSRIVTVTGDGIQQPKNFDALLGTPFSFLVEQAGGYTKRAERLIMGGPMMGFALPSDEFPVVKATNCILVSSKSELRLNQQQEPPTERLVMPCIRCGKCMQACPVELLPQQLYWHARAKDFEKAAEHKLADCIECGACSYVCPSHIPLVDYFRFAKTEIKAQELATLKANQSRERHEFNEYRKVRDKAEREAKRQKQKEALQQKKAGAAGGDDNKQDVIKAAMERAKAKKAALKAQAETQQDDSDHAV